MAFSPFQWFRKHQKVILSVVAIMLMLVFGLTWGMGDLTRYFSGASQQSGPLVTTFNYSSSMVSSQTKVYQADVDKTLRSRQAANDFLINYAYSLRMAPFKLNKEPDPNKMPTYPPVVGSFIQRYRTRMNEPPSPEHFQEILQDLELLTSFRQKPPLTEANTNTEEFTYAIDTLTAALRLELWMADPDRPRDEFFLGGSRSLDGLLDFMLWKHQADRLGITLHEADVRKIMNATLGPEAKVPLTGSLTQNDFAKEYLSSRRGQARTEQELLSDVADEFRVQLAQQALLGAPLGSPGVFYVANGIQQPPLAGTPDEFLNYVRDQRTTLKVAVLAVPVAKYIDPNKKPSEEVLRDLYEAYRNDEPRPDRREPAFKQPRKVRIEYATGQTDAPIFKDKARALLFQPTVQRVSSGFSAFPIGGGPAAGAMITAYPLTRDAILSRYDTYQRRERDMLVDKVGVSPDQYDQHYSAASVVGDFLGSLQQSGPFSVPTTIMATGEVRNEAVAKAAAATVLAGPSPSPVTLALIPFPFTHSVLSLDQVASQLVSQEEEAQVTALIHENLDKLRAELTRLRGKPKDAKKYLETGRTDFTAAVNIVLGPGFQAQNHIDAGPRALGLVINGMSEPKDRYGMVKDPSIKVVRDEYEQMRSFMQQFRRGAAGPDFEEYVLSDNTEYLPESFFLSKTPMLWWRADEVKAVTPKYEDIKGEVLHAWQTQEARREARKFVRDLIDKEVKGRTWQGDAAGRAKEIEALMDAKKAGKVFTLDNVARLWSPETAPNLAAGKTYHTYAPPPTDIEYPPANLVDRLMSLQQPGDAAWFPDWPENHEYVAVLVERSVPTFKDFSEIYANAENRPGRDPMWTYFVRDYRKQFQDQFIRRMREEAIGELDDGKYKVDKEIRARYEKTEGMP
jgi:hypothetical protein